MEAKNQLTGKRNRENGAIFEKYIIKACEEYAEKGDAYIQKTPEPMHIIKPYGENGWFVTNFAKKAQPDFKGVLKGGKAVIFDAKHTDKEKIMQNAINEAQEEFLNGYEALGAECFILVSIGLETFHRVPWTEWKNMKELFGHKFMTKDELQSYKIPGNINRIRFLEGLLCRTSTEEK